MMGVVFMSYFHSHARTISKMISLLEGRQQSMTITELSLSSINANIFLQHLFLLAGLSHL